MLFDFLRYYIKAGNAHSIHSPFVFELYTKIYKDFTPQEEFQELENLRKKLRADDRAIQITDFGAGSHYKNRTIKDIAKHALKSPFWAQFFFRIIRHYNYSHILELGTSLGLTTSYLAKAAPTGKVYTLEGCPQTLQVAEENFDQLELSHIHTYVGNIDQTLPDLLERIEKLDFALLDANHRYTPTLSYFEQCLAKVHERSVLVFDDIYWSDEMKKAWQEIQKRKEVSLSLDFFHVGMVFFRKGVEKQHFVLK
ncbi:O-methyltransferase [Leadbetterella byssophila]|uniref:O-methyltransferase n=1 Tax=Leadbetterella byssophila TaxID=316068 RepID=UPI00399F290B